jgi:hypothetical protein
MNFEQKAGLRAKPGPKKKGGTKGTIGRGKANFLGPVPEVDVMCIWLRGPRGY